MGNRILKESICISNEVNSLNWFEEVLFYRLIVNVDDYGVYPADPLIVMHTLFPRKENVSRRAVAEALRHLEELQLIRRYSVADCGVYLKLLTWEKHQRLRNSRPKYPGPEKAENPGPTASAELTASAAAPAETSGEKPEKETAPDDPAEAETIILLPLNDGSEFRVSRRKADEFHKLYPAVDIDQELRNMRGWCVSNETKRKTRSGILRFVNGWLSRVQNQGSPPPASAKRVVSGNPYLRMIEAEVHQ